MIWTVPAAAAALLVAGFFLAWRLIGTTGRHAGHESFDWTPRPRYRGADRLDRLASQYTLPADLLEDLLRVDRFIAGIDDFLRPAGSRP